MKKAVIGLFIILICIPFYHLAKAFPEGKPLSTFQFETAGYTLSKPVVNELILLPSSDFSEKDAFKMINNIQKVDENILLLAVEESIQVQLFTGSLTNQNGLSELKKVKPKGYGVNDPNWELVPGMSDDRVVYAKIGHSEFGKGHGSICLELHELAHAIDRYVRFDPVFINIWKQEVDQLFPLKNYFLQFPEEYFAEAFAMYYYDENSKKALKENAPLTYKYMKSLEKEAIDQQNNLYVNSQY